MCQKYEFAHVMQAEGNSAPNLIHTDARPERGPAS